MKKQYKIFYLRTDGTMEQPEAIKISSPNIFIAIAALTYNDGDYKEFLSEYLPSQKNTKNIINSRKFIDGIINQLSIKKVKQYNNIFTFEGDEICGVAGLGTVNQKRISDIFYIKFHDY